jgi:hypothetical protein
MGWEPSIWGVIPGPNSRSLIFSRFGAHLVIQHCALYLAEDQREVWCFLQLIHLLFLSHYVNLVAALKIALLALLLLIFKGEMQITYL